MVALHVQRMMCPDDDQLALHVEGGLSPAERTQVAKHLLGCATCRSLVAALAAARTRSRHSTHSTVFPVSTWRWEPGHRVGRFVLQGPLGRGGMGEVYEALDTELGRTVAIKVARAGTQDERVVREGQALARLDHPNVIPVFDAGTHEGAAYIVLARAPGSSLRRWLSTEPRSVQAVLQLFRGVARGTAAMHAIGLVHRDIKPDNILVGEDGQGMLSDFGLASPTRSGSGGTPGYIAPEVERGEEATEASDQYGFCVTLDEALGACARGRVPRWVRAVIHRGRQPSPDDRFGSIDELIRALRHRSAPSRALPMSVAGLGLLAALAWPGARDEPCDWMDDPWPLTEDPSWETLHRQWLVVASESCNQPPAVRACLEGQRRDAGLLLELALRNEPDARPWSRLDPRRCRVPQVSAPSSAIARDRLSEATAARVAGEAAALALAKEALQLAYAIGRADMIAVALAEVGLSTEPPAEATEYLETGYWAALSTEQPEVALDCAVELVDVHSRQTNFEEAQRWLLNARTASSRIGVADLDNEARVELSASLLHQREPAPEEAIAHARRGFVLVKQQTPQSDAMLIAAEARLASSLLLDLQTEAGCSHSNAAWQRQLRLHGEDHPRSVAILIAQSLCSSQRGDFVESLDRLEQAVAIADPPGAAPSRLAADARLLQVSSLMEAGRVSEAAHHADRLQVLYDALHPDDPKRQFELAVNRSTLARRMERYEEARVLGERAVLFANRSFGGRSKEVAMATAELAELALSQKRYEAAIHHLDDVISIFEEFMGPDAPGLGVMLWKQAAAEAALGHDERARALYEKTLSLDPFDDIRGRALLGLAALAKTRAEAEALTRAAIAAYPDLESEAEALLTGEAG